MQYEVVSTRRDIMIGMTKYRYPPSHGMLFILKDGYGTLTMEGMMFPLHVTFLSQDKRVIGTMDVYPGDKAPIPKGTWYMLEVPLNE